MSKTSQRKQGKRDRRGCQHKKLSLLWTYEYTNRGGFSCRTCNKFLTGGELWLFILFLRVSSCPSWLQ